MYRLAAALAIIGIAALTFLHLLPHFGGVDPVNGMISDYGSGPTAPLFTLAMVTLSLASALLGRGMVRSGLLRGASAFAFGSWCVNLLAIAFFVKDPTHARPTLHGEVHLWVTSLACISLPLCGMLVWARFRGDERWRNRARTTGALSIVGAACMLPFVLAFIVNRHSDDRFAGWATGAFERVMVLIDIAAIVVFALWTYALSGSTWRAGVNASRLQLRITGNTSLVQSDSP